MSMGLSTRADIGWSAEIVLDVLEKIGAQEHSPSSIDCTRIWKGNEPMWSCSINIERCGYGTGDTLLGAIDDAIDDFARAGAE